MANTCHTCEYWQARYAPFVKHGFPYVMTCTLEKECNGEHWKPKEKEKEKDEASN